jgi:hypothetical protein
LGGSPSAETPGKPIAPGFPAQTRRGDAFPCGLNGLEESATGQTAHILVLAAKAIFQLLLAHPSRELLARIGRISHYFGGRFQNRLLFHNINKVLPIVNAIF